MHRIDRRLPAETIDELIQAYRKGTPTTQLRKRYCLSQGSVIKILHEHGVEMRGQGLADSDVSAAAELYRGGMTLAQLGNRLRLPQCRAAGTRGSRRGHAGARWE